jgi:hypothetical protein
VVLTREANRIASFFQQSKKMRGAGFHQDRIVERTVGRRILAGKRTDPGGYTEWTGRMRLSEQTAFLSQCIQIRRTNNRIAVHRQGGGLLLINHDQNGVCRHNTLR